MRQVQRKITLSMRGRGLLEFTHEVRDFLRSSGLSLGHMMIFCRHTSASLLIQENADPSVCDDLLAFFASPRAGGARTSTATKMKAPTTCRRICARR